MLGRWWLLLDGSVKILHACLWHMKQILYNGLGWKLHIQQLGTSASIFPKGNVMCKVNLGY